MENKIKCINCKNAFQQDGKIYCKVYKDWFALNYETKECDKYISWGDGLV